MPQEIVTFGPSLVGATLVVLVHLSIPRLKFLHGPQSIWLDFLAGVALGYVFVDILPHLATFQEKLLRATDGGLLGFLEHHAYLMAMAGFLLYLGIAVAGERIKSRQAGETIMDKAPPLAAGFKALSLLTYAFLIGYMLAEQPTHRAAAGFGFGVAMAGHFLGLDHFFRDLYPRLYDTKLRYLLSGATYGGWMLGVVGELPDHIYALLFTFLAGGLMIVTAVFELPRVNSWRPYAGFCLGAIVFTALIVLAQTFGL